MRVLLAEDDSNVALITQICLEKIGGHNVTLVTDGEQAAARALSDNFDLILLDGMMPKLHGIQAAKKIRESGNKETPIIFLSARSDEKDIKEFLSLGNGYIAKPFDPQLICAKIDEILLKNRKLVS